ncbi:Uncharacterized protein TCM_037629 [Theobroma cacao]|uniref:Uncharacterized protein n=1 Tax=Theobroma cacao TaxID=3641 RepID=A0A061GLI3_THECC|nr:Uncharacterized protein TCM_037629 [Theobroma cacao]
MQKLMLSLAGFRSAFGVMSAYRDVATVVTGLMGVPGRDMIYQMLTFHHETFQNHLMFFFSWNTSKFFFLMHDILNDFWWCRGFFWLERDDVLQ